MFLFLRKFKTGLEHSLKIKRYIKYININQMKKKTYRRLIVIN